jgi:hypothetical protein
MANKDLNGTSYIYDTNATPETRAVISQRVRLYTPAFGQRAGTKHQLGVVSSLSVDNSRSVEPIRGIGFGDQIADLVPGVTEPETASLERTMLYGSTLAQATGYGYGFSGPVRSLRHHKWPFDMEQQIVTSQIVDRDISNGATDLPEVQDGTSTVMGVTVQNYNANNNLPAGQHYAIITMYETCWFNSLSASFASDSAMVSESGSVTVRNVHDANSAYGEFLNSGNNPFLGQIGSRIYG